MVVRCTRAFLACPPLRGGVGLMGSAVRPLLLVLVLSMACTGGESPVGLAAPGTASLTLLPLFPANAQASDGAPINLH